MHDWRFNKRGDYFIYRWLDNWCRLGREIDNRTGRNSNAEKIAKCIGAALVGEMLILRKIYRGGLDPDTILHGALDFIREDAAVLGAAGAFRAQYTVLSDLEANGRKVDDLASLLLLCNRLAGKRKAANIACQRQRMNDCVINRSAFL